MNLTHADSLVPPYELEKLTQDVRDQMDQMVRDSQDPNWKPSFPFDGSCADVNRIREYASKWQALDTLYNLPSAEKRCHPLVNIRNIQAIRNRLKLVKLLLRQQLFTLKEVQTPRILEVAAGSAQAVIEIMAETSLQMPGIQALLLDFDPTAMAHATTLADHCGVGDRIQTIVGNALRQDNAIDQFRPHILEMVGLADYLEDSLFVILLRRFHRYLPPGGILIVGNVIAGNPEQAFIERIYNWPSMIYRTVEELRELIQEAGFSECTIETEPHNIHAVAVARTNK